MSVCLPWLGLTHALDIAFLLIGDIPPRIKFIFRLGAGRGRGTEAQASATIDSEVFTNLLPSEVFSYLVLQLGVHSTQLLLNSQLLLHTHTRYH